MMSQIKLRTNKIQMNIDANNIKMKISRRYARTKDVIQQPLYATDVAKMEESI